jgi:hypothetical protein
MTRSRILSTEQDFAPCCYLQLESAWYAHEHFGQLGSSVLRPVLDGFHTRLEEVDLKESSEIGCNA